MNREAELGVIPIREGDIVYLSAKGRFEVYKIGEQDDVESPIGKALMNKRVGDMTPLGKIVGKTVPEDISQKV